MLQANEITQRFQHLQVTIDEAQRACQAAQDAPPEIRNCIDRLSKEYRQTQPVIASNDQMRIMQAVDKLEDMGDEAKRLSRNSPQIPAQLERVKGVLYDPPLRVQQRRFQRDRNFYLRHIKNSPRREFQLIHSSRHQKTSVLRTQKARSANVGSTSVHGEKLSTENRCVRRTFVVSCREFSTPGNAA